MTDRLKGVLVTFDTDIRIDDAEDILTALKMVKGVLSVKDYVTSAEDYMMYHRGYHDCQIKLLKEITKPIKDPS